MKIDNHQSILPLNEPPSFYSRNRDHGLDYVILTSSDRDPHGCFHVRCLHDCDCIIATERPIYVDQLNSFLCLFLNELEVLSDYLFCRAPS